MVYVSNGAVQQKRTLWRWSIIGDFLSAIVSAIHLFISSLWNVDATAIHGNRNRSSSSSSSYYQRNQQQQRRSDTNPNNSSSAPGASRRANIRTFRNLGPANASCGGGG